MKKIIFIAVLLMTAKAFAQVNPDSVSFGLLLPSKEVLEKFPFQSFMLPPAYQLPPLADMSSMCPPAGNQMNQGSCAAWTTAYGLKSYQENLEHRWGYGVNQNVPDADKVFSPAFVFNTYKAQRQPCECASGMYFSDAFNILQGKGCSKWSDFPYDGNMYGCCKSVPDDVYNGAIDYKIASYQRLLMSEISELKYYLSIGIPVAIGIALDNTFVTGGNLAAQTGNDFFWNPPLGSPTIGYHAMLCVGYDDNTQSFKVLNSWGQNWGRNGYVQIPYNVFFQKVNEAYISFDAISNTAMMPANVPESPNPNIVSGNKYSNWFKPGFYRDFNEVRIGLLYLNETKGEAIVQFSDSRNNKIINSLLFKINTTKSFYYNGNKITFNFDSIGKAGRKNTPAVFFTFVTEITTPDPSIERILNNNKYIETEIKQVDIFKQQQQQQHRQQLQQQQQQQLRQ